MKQNIALVLAFGLLLFVIASYHQRAGVLKAQIAHLEKSRTYADSIHRVEVSELANEMLRYKNLRRVVKITDTVAVKDLLASVDSTIQACTDVVGSCKEQVAVRDSLIAKLKKLQPSRFSCVFGAAGNHKGIGPGVACGFRF